MQGNRQASNFYSLNQSSLVEFYFFHRYIIICLKCEWSAKILMNFLVWIGSIGRVCLYVSSHWTHRVIINMNLFVQQRRAEMTYDVTDVREEKTTTIVWHWKTPSQSDAALTLLAAGCLWKNQNLLTKKASGLLHLKSSVKRRKIFFILMKNWLQRSNNNSFDIIINKMKTY